MPTLSCTIHGKMPASLKRHSQDVKEDTSLLSDDDDDDEMEDLDALAKGMDAGRPAPGPKAPSAAETTKNTGVSRTKHAL